ncbi:MAG: GIY-YIG nuclease family protein [Candidatus Wildermuthbacteria bacterium]|nr:GIY-YIG nuclease family protein [Candidatus Wildermuthbacteria bacterium]
MKYTVYVVRNRERNKIYIGYTSNLIKRLARHNKELPGKKSSFTSKMNGHWEVAYSEDHSTIEEAMAREKYLKSYRGRAFIKKIIGQ